MFLSLGGISGLGCANWGGRCLALGACAAGPRCCEAWDYCEARAGLGPPQLPTLTAESALALPGAPAPALPLPHRVACCLPPPRDSGLGAGGRRSPASTAAGPNQQRLPAPWAGPSGMHQGCPRLSHRPQAPGSTVKGCWPRTPARRLVPRKRNRFKRSPAGTAAGALAPGRGHEYLLHIAQTLLIRSQDGCTAHCTLVAPHDALFRPCPALPSPKKTPPTPSTLLLHFPPSPPPSMILRRWAF